MEASTSLPTSTRKGPDKLTPEEEIWAARFEFLKGKGYLLRPRYRPGWVASWTQTPGALASHAEDGIMLWRATILDAERISDGSTVFLKCAPKESPELEIGRFLCSDELKHDPRNHSAPLLEVLEDERDPEHVIMVMPLLRPVDMPLPASVREYMDFIQQTLEGLVFLHEHEIAHRDCAYGNIMMDGSALFPRGWHPQSFFLERSGRPLKDEKPSRTARGGVRYYIIDFGISTRGQAKTVGFDGQERVPELSDDVPYDPYKLDVYVLGMAYKRLLEQYHMSSKFIEPIIKDMIHQDPEKRITAAEALERFEGIRRKMTWMTLSQRLQPALPEPRLTKTVRDAKYRLNEILWAVKPKQRRKPLW
ncbi:hypothetical protein FRB99_000617 [Tulasnella sp. 403]|nr:hypothetical protein FRB99_000617 [Tulasnella sp. 403]